MMGSTLCTGCGKQPVLVLPQARTAIPQKLNHKYDHGGAAAHQPNHQNSNKDHCQQLTNHDDKMLLMYKSQKERGDGKEKVDGTIELAWCNKVEYEI
jgi:hypothetical protein